MASVGNITIGFGVNFGDLDLGIGRASNRVQSFVGQLGTMGGSLKGMLVGLGAAFGVSKIVGGIQSLHAASAESIDVQAKLADRVGTTTENLIGLQHAANLSGVEAGELDVALTKLGVNLANAASGSGPAKDALDALGLSAAELAGKDRVEAMAVIADKLNEIENPAKRSALAVEIFGKAGARLAPLLAEGSEGIARNVAEAERLGISFSRLDAAKVEAANDAWSRMGTVVEGLGNQLAIQLAPFLEAAATKFTDLASAGIDMGSVVGKSLEFVGTAVGIVADAAQVLGIAFKGAQVVATGAWSGIALAIASVGEALASVINLIPGMNVQFGTTARAIADDLAALADQQLAEMQTAMDKPLASEGIAQFFAGIQSGANAAAEAVAGAGDAIGSVAATSEEMTKGIADLTEKLQTQVATFGMSSAQADLYKLGLEGATEEQLAGARALAGQLDALTAEKKAREEADAAQEKLVEEGKSMTEALATPYEKATAEIIKLQKLFDAGVIDQETLARGLEKAESAGGDKSQFAGALEAGSQEARSAILASRGMNLGGTGSTGDAQKDVAKNTKDSLTVQQRIEIGISNVANKIGDFVGGAVVQVFPF